MVAQCYISKYTEYLDNGRRTLFQSTVNLLFVSAYDLQTNKESRLLKYIKELSKQKNFPKAHLQVVMIFIL